LYRYVVDGSEYHSNQYGLSDFRTLWWYAGKRRIAMSYHDGQQTTCWIDPRDPSQAVLSRGVGAPILWFALVIPFGVLGVAGIRQHSTQSIHRTISSAMTLKLIGAVGLLMTLPIVSVILPDGIADIRDGIWTVGEIVILTVSVVMLLGSAMCLIFPPGRFSRGRLTRSDL
jgi:hypothetical protein